MSNINFKNLDLDLDIVIEHRDKLLKENKELKSDIEYLLKNMTFTNDEKVMLILDNYT